MNDSEVRRHLDAAVDERIDRLEVFAEIDSTNSYLLEQSCPAVDRWHIVIADRQIAGRGRGDKQWHSPAGGGLWMSGAYTFDELPKNLSALTLSIGVGAAHVLQRFGVDDVALKWPNDLLVGNQKLGGILLDSTSVGGSNLTVVCGLGVNVDIGGARDMHTSILRNGDLKATDLKRNLSVVPALPALAAAMIEAFAGTMNRYIDLGFEGFVDDWSKLDWLSGRRVVVSQQQQRREGTASGIAANGALILRDGEDDIHIVSGSVRLADDADAVA